MQIKAFKFFVLPVIFIVAAVCLPLYVHAAALQQENKLRVAIKMLEPFVFKRDGKLTGFSIDLWEAIAKDRGWDYELIEVETVTQQLDSVTGGSADLAIAGISMTPDREQIVDFSHPYFDSGLQIMTSVNATGSLSSWAAAVLSPTLFGVLGIGLIILIILMHIIWLIERGSNDAMPKQYLPGIWEACWWTVSTVSTMEYGNKEKPRSRLKQLFAMVMVVLCIVLIAQFTAAITASITVHQLTGNINGPSDLPGKAVVTVQGSTSMKYLDREGIRCRTVTRIEEAYRLLTGGDVQAIVYDAPVLQYYANSAGKGSVAVVGTVFEQESYGIALPVGSPLRKLINEALLRLQQNGTYDAIYSKWFGGQ